MRAIRSCARRGRSGAGARRPGEPASAFLGYDNKDFEFSDLENAVTFVECSARAGAGALRPIELWLRTQYPF